MFQSLKFSLVIIFIAFRLLIRLCNHSVNLDDFILNSLQCVWHTNMFKIKILYLWELKKTQKYFFVTYRKSGSDTNRVSSPGENTSGTWSIRYIRVDQTRKPGCSFKHIARRHTTCNCRVKRGLQILMIKVLHGNVK